MGGEREVNPLEGVLSASPSPRTQPVAAFAKEGAAQRCTQESAVRKAGLGGLQEPGEHREGKEAGVGSKPEPCPRGFSRGGSRVRKRCFHSGRGPT